MTYCSKFIQFEILLNLVRDELEMMFEAHCLRFIRVWLYLKLRRSCRSEYFRSQSFAICINLQLLFDQVIYKIRAFIIDSYHVQLTFWSLFIIEWLRVALQKRSFWYKLFPSLRLLLNSSFEKDALEKMSTFRFIPDVTFHESIFDFPNIYKTIDS